MSQLQWTYVDDFGKHYKVGLFHGMRTGHLMIYCNKRVLLIDFHVNTSKKYSFFINDELFDIIVDHDSGTFSYGLEIDNKTNTPRNRLRRKIHRKDMVGSLVLLSIFIGVVTVIVFFMLNWNQYF